MSDGERSTGEHVNWLEKRNEAVAGLFSIILSGSKTRHPNKVTVAAWGKSPLAQSSNRDRSQGAAPSEGIPLNRPCSLTCVIPWRSFASHPKLLPPDLWEAEKPVWPQKTHTVRNAPLSRALSSILSKSFHSLKHLEKIKAIFQKYSLGGRAATAAVLSGRLSRVACATFSKRWRDERPRSSLLIAWSPVGPLHDQSCVNTIQSWESKRYQPPRPGPRDGGSRSADLLCTDGLNTWEENPEWALFTGLWLQQKVVQRYSPFTHEHSWDLTSPPSAASSRARMDDADNLDFFYIVKNEKSTSKSHYFMSSRLWSHIPVHFINVSKAREDALNPSEMTSLLEDPSKQKHSRNINKLKPVKQQLNHLAVGLLLTKKTQQPTSRNSVGISSEQILETWTDSVHDWEQKVAFSVSVFRVV